MYGNGEENVGGANGGEAETDRYQGIGAAMAKRKAYQTDFGSAMGNEAQGWQAHGNQNEAANGMRQAAMGGAPSQAAILGGQAAGQSLQGQMQAGAGARGLGQAAAQMQAAQGVGQQQLGAMGQMAGMRGAEMQHAQDAYGQAGGAMRAGDYAQQGMAQQRTEAQAASENAQRAMNQQAQLHYEQMGVRNNQAQSENELRMKGVAGKENDTNDRRHDEEQSRLGKWIKSGVSTAGTIFSMFSDERTKDRVVPLSEDAGVERHWDADVPVSAARPDAVSGASLSGPTPKYSSPQPAAAPPKPSLGQSAAKKQRKPTDAELKRMADEMLGTQSAQHEASLGNGPSVHDPMGAALEQGLKPFEYEYKPQFAGQERQQPGEKNVGPMAQDMASNSITGSAVKRDPASGLLMIDMPKATKLNSAGIGYLAAKLRKQDEEIARMKGGR